MMLLFWVLAAYGTVSIISWGSIFEELRTWVKTKSNFFGTLITCPLCLGFWTGFVMSLTLGGLCNHYFNTHWGFYLFADSVFTSGAVWAINAIIEFFEESRIK